MANQEHLDILKQGVEVWNQWRHEHPKVRPDLSSADLHKADLQRIELNASDLKGVNLNQANLSGAELSGADFRYAKLEEVNLSEAILSSATLSGADLYKANLSNATLFEAHLVRSNLSKANLSGARLYHAILVETNLTDANMTGCFVYGISTWNVQLSGATQSSLIITDVREPLITVDNLEVAQFIYLLLNNQKIRDVIDTITSKVVLILGRFTPERKTVLDALRDELRKKNYLPIVFDFQKPANRDLTETVSTLAHMARFVIADITDPKSIPQELKTIVPNLPSVPVQPLLQARAKEYGMFEHFKSFPWVLEAYRYTTVDRLLASLKEEVIEPAEQKAQELAKR